MDVESAGVVKSSPGNQVPSEIISYDILEHVFSHLKNGDLCRAARVSKLWNETARQEFSRRGLEIFVLPSPRKSNELHSVAWRRRRIEYTYTVLRGRPRAAILFTDNTLVGDDEPTDETYSQYSGYFSRPAEVIVARALDVTVNGNNAIRKGRVPGLLFPEAQSLEYTFVSLDNYDVKESIKDGVDLPRQIVEDLLSTTHEHVCIIMFLAIGWSGTCLESFWSNVLSNVKNKYSPGKFSFWGGRVRALSKSGCIEDDRPVIHAVSLSGPTQRSWSIVLDCKLSVPETEEQLLTFKSHVSIKSTSVALLFVPARRRSTRKERSLKTKVFKSIFPNVETLCIFTDDVYPQCGVSSTSSIGDQEVRHMDSITCLIFT